MIPETKERTQKFQHQSGVRPTAPANEPRKEIIMSNINASVKSASAAYFTFDLIRKTIVGSEFNFKMAGNPTKAQYDALMDAMAMQPTYTLAPIAPTKKVEKKQSYKGLTSDLIAEYVGVFGNDTQKAELEKMVNNNETYPTIKSWFLDYFKVGFTVEKAKREIANRKLNTRKAVVRKVVKASMVKAAPAADAA